MCMVLIILEGEVKDGEGCCYLFIIFLGGAGGGGMGFGAVRGSIVKKVMDILLI